VIVLLYLLTTALVLFVFILHPGINRYSRAKFSDMVYGQAHKPFVYRALLPSAVRVVAEVTPEGLKEEIGLVVQNKGRHLIPALGWETEYLYEYFVALILMFCCLAGFAFTLRRLAALFYDFPSFVADLAPIGGLLVLPVFFRYCNYIYDPCTLLLFTAGIASIARRRAILFYVVFVLATLNKETSILLAGLFLMRDLKVVRNSSLAGHVLLQVSLWLAVRALIMVVFRGNPGSFLEVHLVHNLGLIFDPKKLLYFGGVISVFTVLIGSGWAGKPVFLRRGLLVTMIPLVFLALFLGYVDELRGYYETFPFLLLLSLPTMVEIFGSSTKSQRNGQAERLPGRQESG
jgi:hypothetical protein